MKFSVDVRDELFGERVEIEVLGPGGVIKSSVTKKWLDQMQAEGRMSKVAEPLIQVHILHSLSGYRVDHWTIGKDLDTATIAKFQDASTQALYAVTYLEAGEPQTKIMSKSDWEKVKVQLAL